jgi:hypothetical protein
VKAGNNTSRQRVFKWMRRGIDNMQARAAEPIQEHSAKHGAVIYIHPFGRCDESAEVASSGDFSCSQKKMHVQACKLACADSKACGRPGEPRLCIVGDFMMPYIRGVADKKRAPINVGKRQFTIVAYMHRKTIRDAYGGRVRAQEQGWQRVDLDRNQSGFWECSRRR